MQKSESIGNLAKALAAAQKEIRAAPLNASNPFFKSKYADLGAIIESARAPLAANGLAVSQSPFTRDGQIGVETILMHESGEWLSNELALPLGEVKGKSLAQEVGSILTYLRRYAYAATVVAYADDDTDGNADPNARTTRPAPEKRPEPDPAPPQNQWTRDPAEWAKFVAVAKEYGLSQQAVKDILQVQSFHDYKGTREQATARLVEFAKGT